MKLFSKEKGIVFSIFNAILLIWILVAIVLTITNLTSLFIANPVYTYEEYKLFHCDLKYETEETCKLYYDSYKYDLRYEENMYKREIITSLSQVILIPSVLLILNIKPKRQEK